MTIMPLSLFYIGDLETQAFPPDLFQLYLTVQLPWTLQSSVEQLGYLHFQNAVALCYVLDHCIIATPHHSYILQWVNYGPMAPPTERAHVSSKLATDSK